MVELNTIDAKITEKNEQLQKARAQMDELIKQKDQLEREIQNEINNKIASVPELLGVSTMDEAISLMRGVTILETTEIKRHHLNKQENRDLKTALLGGMTNEVAARKFGIGESTVYAKRRHFKIATRSRKIKTNKRRGGSRRLTQNEKVAIKALHSKGTSVANIADDFKVSRATIYHTINK